MKLLLTSNGITDDIHKESFSLFQEKHGDRSVLFVTTAAYGEVDNPTWLEDYRNQLRRNGITKIIDFDVKNKTLEECSKKLEQVDMVFINGGNTFYLLYWIRKSGFDKAIGEFVNNNGAYIGVSAGSIIACPTIDTAKWEPADENKVGITDLKALGWVKFLISPHFESSQKSVIETWSLKSSYPAVALTNEQAILVKDEKIKVIGEGEKVFFNSFSET